MLKQVTLFFNTGFNSINFPADPQTLYLFENKNYPVMDLVQENFLSAIKIKATEEEILDADYLRIGDAYYSIEGYAMNSVDVVSLAITQNAILSVGGLNELEFITGEVYRSTALNHIDMDFDDYRIQDELLSYSERRPTKKYRAYSKKDNIAGGVSYEKGWYGSASDWYEAHGSGYDLDIYTSMYDDTVPEKPSDLEIQEVLGEEGAAAWSTLQTAWIGRREFETVITMSGHDIAHATDIRFEMPAVSMYTGPGILNAALVMNGFGINNFIIDSYTIPRDFVDVISTNGHILELNGKSNRARIGLGLNYEEVLDPDRKLRNLNPIIREVIANQAIEVTIESMMTGESNTLPLSDVDVEKFPNGLRRINIDMIADPSPNGCPYYKLVVKDHYGESGTVEGNAVDTMLGSIRGATWMPNPLLFERSGFTRDMTSAKVNQAYRRTMFDNSKEYDYSMYFNNLTGKIANTASLGAIQAYDAEANLQQAYRDNLYYGMNKRTADNSLAISLNKDQRLLNAHSTNSGLQMNAMMNAAGNVVSAGQDWHAIQSSQLLSHGNMQAQYAAEMLQLGLAHPGRELELRFPISDNGQLLLGNGIMVNIRSINETDLDRYIRALQLYGVACNGKMDIQFVTRYNNEPYHYIQAHGVSVKYSENASRVRKINKQLLSAITDMFAVGFRVWYEKPTDESYKKMYVEEDQ